MLTRKVKTTMQRMNAALRTRPAIRNPRERLEAGNSVSGGFSRFAIWLALPGIHGYLCYAVVATRWAQHRDRNSLSSSRLHLL
jgi:hypothetical protein